MNHLRIKHLQLITAIVQTGSLTKAAARLNISQPAASHQLRHLEDLLGMPAFSRNRKKMMLTKTGENILASANRIIGELNNLEFELSRQMEGNSGELKIGIHCAYSFKWIPEAIAKFWEAYPNVRLTVGNSWKTLKELQAKTWDIIITVVPFKDESIQYSSLFQDEILVIMNPGYPLALKPFLEPGDFKNECFISLTDKSHDMFWTGILKPANVALKRFMTVEQAEAAISLVKKGLGISLFPRFAVKEHIMSGSLVGKRFTSQILRTDWLAARLTSEQIPVYQDAFIQIAKEYLESNYN